MNSLIEDKILPNSDQKSQLTSSNRGKLLNKPYSFFIFYKLLTTADQKLTSLEKLSFRLREDKQPVPSDKYLDKNERNEKLVNLFFANIDNQNDLQTSFMDLKFHIVQSYESDLLRLIDKTSHFGIDIKLIPFAVYSPTLNDDLALFLGWKQEQIGNIAQKSPDQLSVLANQWISSPSEKIDVWQIHFKVKENGKISKLEYDFEAKSYFLKDYQNVLDKKDYFMSHFSVGYHSKMFMEFQTSKKVQQSSFFSKIKFGFEGFKKFCCVGNQSMKSSTGIVNISFKDERNSEMQIMKEFYDQEDGQLTEQKKYKHNRKVLSIVLANIDTYYGQKLSACRMNDGKIELLSFDSKKQNQKIGSIAGQIKLKFETEQEVCLKIGDSFYVLEHPVEAIIKQFTKMKSLINKETVGC